MRTVLYHIERKCLLMAFERNFNDVAEKAKACTNGFESVELMVYMCAMVESTKRALFQLDNPFKRGCLIRKRETGVNVDLCSGERVLTKNDIDRLDAIRYAIQNHQQKTVS